MQHRVDVVYAINDKQMIDEIEYFKPDIILCPYLKTFIPKDIFNKYKTFIFHPGIIGDKGAYSIDNAVKDNKKQWGVVILKANNEFDCGDIYAHSEFDLRDTYKASIYRNETYIAFGKALNTLLEALKNPNFKPIKQIQNPMHLQLSQKHRRIDWNNDTTEQIIRKINISDSYPGVEDEILNTKCYLFGTKKEDKLRGDIKQILAKRDGAICIGTKDGAIWISHLKEVDKFKLPATYVLKEKLKGVRENRIPLIFDKSYNTFFEISHHIENDIAYLDFNFHNGAINTQQCMRLKYTIEVLQENVKAIVLMGGDDFFSNGIHLNILEDSKKNGEDGWSNINAMNDLVKSVIFCKVMTIASFKNNAGAGGVFLGLACDYAVASSYTILNPHYKTLGLSGSEYHTYILEKKSNKQTAEKLLNECLPISSQKAKDLNLIDKVFNIDKYQTSIKDYCNSLIQDEDKYEDFIWDKEDFLDENANKINKYKENEIKTMYDEFWEKDSIFHKLRYEFVYKICPQQTPIRLKYKEI